MTTPPRKPPYTDVSYYPGVYHALMLFVRTVEGPYAVQVDGILRLGDVWVEVSVVLSRDINGLEDYHVIPKANAKSIPVANLKVVRQNPPEHSKDDPVVLAHQGYGKTKPSDVAATLTAHDGKGGPGTWVLEGGALSDDPSDAEIDEFLDSLPDVQPKSRKRSAAAQRVVKAKRKAKTAAKPKVARKSKATAMVEPSPIKRPPVKRRKVVKRKAAAKRPRGPGKTGG